MRKITIGVFILILTFFFAKETSALTLSPTRFEISGNPGETLKQEILLINETTKVETYSSSYTNFEAQGESGDPAFVEAKEDLGTWIKTDQNTIVIPPKQQKTVPFTVTIPKDAEPGGHFAVIFWSTTAPGSTSTPNVAITAKTGVLVLLSVNGDVKQAAGLLNFNTGGNRFWYNTLPVNFEYRVKNDGGDRIKPQGKITIRNSVFLPTKRLNANPVEGNVLPSSTRKFKMDWIEYERSEDYIAPTGFFKKFWSDAVYQWRNFAVGLYSANLNIAYGTDEQGKSTVFFFVFPWQLLLVLLILISITTFVGRKIIKRYNKYIISKARMG